MSSATRSSAWEVGTGSSSVPSSPQQAAVGTAGDLDVAAAKEVIDRLEVSVGQVVHGKAEVIRLTVVSLLAGGHILIEDVPGVGKTTLAQALARTIGLAFQRIQQVAGELPSDIIGVSIFNQKEQSFELVPGPLF